MNENDKPRHDVDEILSRFEVPQPPRLDRITLDIIPQMITRIAELEKDTNFNSKYKIVSELINRRSISIGQRISR